jgi:beta-lactamase class A
MFRILTPALALVLAGCAGPSEFERMSDLERRVRLEVERQAPGSRLHLWLSRADGRVLLDLDADRVLPAASTLKVLVLVEGYAQELEGRFRWSDDVTLLAEDRVGGAGTLQFERPGSTWTYRQLARRMIAESDNSASNILLRRLGLEAVNRRARALGLERTRFERAFLDFAARREGRENLSSAAEMGRLMRAIFRREILTPEACDEMIAVLERTSRGRIARGVPKDVPVGHKAGSLPGYRHDVGWVRLPGQPYVLSLFLENVLESTDPNVDRGIAAIEGAARLVYEAMGPTDE